MNPFTPNSSDPPHLRYHRSHGMEGQARCVAVVYFCGHGYGSSLGLTIPFISIPITLYDFRDYSIGTHGSTLGEI